MQVWPFVDWHLCWEILRVHAEAFCVLCKHGGYCSCSLNVIIIIICYINNTFLLSQSALHLDHSTTPSVQHPPDLDDATAAILGENAHHTPGNWWRGDSDEVTQYIWGWLGGHDEKQWPIFKFCQDASVQPLLSNPNPFFQRTSWGF